MAFLTTTRKTLLRYAVALTTTVVLAIATPALGQSGPKNFLRIGDGSSRIDSINPFAAGNVFALLTVRTLYPYLLQYGLDGRVTTDFAKQYHISDDGLTWTFEVPSGATWSDGQPLTAQDAAWTIKTMLTYKDSSAGRFNSFVSNIADATATSDTELVIKFAVVASTSADSLAQIPILPQHIWEPVAGSDGAGLASFANTAPVSAGPFEIQRFSAPESIIFRRNDHFYGQEPKLDGFGVVFYSNADAAVNALQAGEIDAAYEVPATSIASLKANKDVVVNVTKGNDIVVFEVNSRSTKKTHTELMNPKVREALDLAIDKDAIVQVVSNGLGSRSATFVPPSAGIWYNDTIPLAGYDVDRANKILDDLGYARGPDGIRVANGERMEYRFIYPDVATGAPRAITMIAEMLSHIGIDAKTQSSDFPSYTAAVYRDDYANFEFNLNDYIPGIDPNQHLGIPTCGQINGSNQAGYCNKEYDDLYAKQSVTIDTDARRAIVFQLQEIIADDLPIIPIYVDATITAQRANVRDLPTSPLLINYISKEFLLNATVDK